MDNDLFQHHYPSVDRILISSRRLNMNSGDQQRKGGNQQRKGGNQQKSPLEQYTHAVRQKKEWEEIAIILGEKKPSLEFLGSKTFWVMLIIIFILFMVLGSLIPDSVLLTK